MSTKPDIALEIIREEEDKNLYDCKDDDEDYYFTTTTSRTQLFDPSTEKQPSCKKLWKNICFWTSAIICLVFFVSLYMLPALVMFFISKDNSVGVNITNVSTNSTLYDTTLLYRVSFAIKNNTAH
jgi:hypothetical protein